MKLLGRIILAVFVLQLPVACGESHDDVRAAIFSYTALLAQGYRTMNMNGLATVATPDQAARAYHHMAALGEGLVAMDSELRHSEYEQISRPADDQAEATVKERWRYRYRDLRTGEYGDFFTVNYTVRYYLVRQAAIWRIDRITVLAADRSLGDDKLPFFQRPADVPRPWEKNEKGKANP